MNKIKVTAARVDQYTIEIDPEKWNEESLAGWSSVFHQVDSVNEIAEDLAFKVLRQGSGRFFEGYGHVKTFTAAGREICQFKRDDVGEHVQVREDEYCQGIVIWLIKEDDEHDFEVEEAV